MRRLKVWGLVAAVAGLLIGIAAWWEKTEAEVRAEPLNQHEAYVYTDNARIYWFELDSRKGEIEGYFHNGKLIEEDGEPPSLVRQRYRLTGKKTENGYELTVNKDGKMITYDIAFSGPHLSVKRHGDPEAILYNPVNQKELDEYVIALLDYNTESKENEQIRQFFSDLNSMYGYLSFSGEEHQLFIKIDEALQQGELSGSLLIMTDTGDANTPYKGTTYNLNGITDGKIVEFYTNVDGKDVKLEGEFQGDATSFTLSFWTTGEILSFTAIREEEFKQYYEEFKKKSQD
ncbi:hypothetical protein A8F94_08755 [Bacillus sp. FJAT-27225]|uniref:hypothetical protein n=1 Tax=Bacillus sp. FJAT-27225 TaxID=1743144 RepID=UPI00080C2731|nr:hypothetical protein [Bacillus sp. FJAT-27225]OCA87911.1 hypothetical protein A8F94_08755 [Bacillus sp. FJAT-27225]